MFYYCCTVAELLINFKAFIFVLNQLHIKYEQLHKENVPI